MLLRPFLAEGHLHKHSNDSEKEKMARTCISHAMAIWKLVAAYRKAFTLRRAPFLLSYAVYSAVVVILKRNAPERAHLRDAATFFWTALSELQRGCNFGLQKPLTILRQMMAKLGETGETGETGQTGQMCEALPQAPEPALQDSMLAMLDKHASRGSGGEPPDDLSQMDPSGISADLFDPTMHVDDYGTLDFLDDQERIISDDALYGLFAPPHSLL
ncbi:hypothetical protein SBRCBS47491_009288 [Sporothrix bragantina]|uniref:Fungal specific transcription factor n=1 Tax=Sporothrix bragantina TaxID=671064 RepID=A0ABP0CTK4_9PEZI